MSKAEDLAKELYPLLETDIIGNNPCISYNTEQLAKQEGFVEGYHQAEKDLDVVSWVKEVSGVKELSRAKEETIFMTKYGIKEMEFYCANDDMYQARFTDENGETFTFNASRAKVMEHVERFASHPELYVTNKNLVVSHFHRMARAFYAMAHLPKER